MCVDGHSLLTLKSCLGHRCQVMGPSWVNLSSLLHMTGLQSIFLKLKIAVTRRGTLSEIAQKGDQSQQEPGLHNLIRPILPRLSTVVGCVLGRRIVG